MSLITLAYSIPVGVQRVQDQLARVAAIDLTRGELDLLQMSVFDDTTSFQGVAGSGLLRRAVTLEPSAQGEIAFPTDQSKVDATVGLYGGQLDLNVPSNVVRVAPLVEAVTPLDFADFVEWWRADMAVTEDVDHLLSAWANKAPGFPGSLTAAGALRPLREDEDANFALRASVQFDGTDRMDSDLAASSWNFLHNGLIGVTIIIVARPTSVDPVQVALSTATIASVDIGVNIYYDGTARSWFFEVGNGAAQIISASTAVGSATPNTRHFVVARFEEGRPGNEFSIRANASTVEGNTAGAPSAADAAATLRVGASAVSGADPIFAAVPEVVIYADYLSDADVEALLDDYFVPRYGTFP